MSLKYFILKSTNESIAINSEKVIYVVSDESGTKINFVNGNSLLVASSLPETVARLNEL